MHIRALLICSLFLGLLGCGTTPVVQDLTQRQATEIVAVLNSNGIQAVAERETGGRGVYRVEIPEDQYPQAVQLINQKNLPSEHRPSVQELLAPQGLIPSSREVEALRLDYALAGEIEEMLSSHPGVASAHAVVRSNAKDEGQDPSVSIVIQLPSESSSVKPEELIPLIARTVPGLKPDGIFMTIGVMTKADDSSSTGAGGQAGLGDSRNLVSFLWWWKVPQSEYAGLAVLFSLIVIVVGFAAAGLGYWTCLYHRTRDPVESNFPEILPKSLKFDRVRKEIPE